jgi:salicylate biosynthesis isochorismate synthase
MTLDVASPLRADAALAPDAAAQAALAAARARAARERRPVLLCLARPLDAGLDPLALVDAARAAGVSAALFARPDGALGLAALGRVWMREASGASRVAAVGDPARALLTDAVVDGDAAPIAIAAFGFADQPATDALWRGFPAARVAVPRVALLERAGAAHLLVQALVRPDASAAEVGAHVARSLARLRTWSAPRRRPAEQRAPRYTTASRPAPARYAGAVADTTAEIAAGHFEKLVLARACTLRAARPFSCARAAARLRQSYPGCTTFWLGDRGGDFIGATPESLVRVRGGEVDTTALAGTIGRGTTAASDTALAEALLRSDKNRREHAIVVAALADGLRPLCSALSIDAAPRILRLPSLQHLLTPIRGRLAPGAHLLDLVAALHPTPAVGGAPRAAALAALPDHESVSRGWYAGPVGWFDARGDGDMVVAIRSALVRGRRAVLFAGAGIVAGSDPDAELTETRLKLQPLLSALLEL